MTACGEETEDEGEFANWQQRNEVFFASLSDSLNRNPSQWVRYKCYSLDETVEGDASDYIYAKVIHSGTETDSPMFTDSIRVSYQGRLIPSATYPQGYPFDGTVNGTYSDKTNSTARLLLSQMIDGYVTALLHMHRGDYWRVYIPSALAYGDTGNGGTIPGHSVVVFDVTLIDFSPVGEVMPRWSARRVR